MGLPWDAGRRMEATLDESVRLVEKANWKQAVAMQMNDCVPPGCRSVKRFSRLGVLGRVVCWRLWVRRRVMRVEVSQRMATIVMPTYDIKFGVEFMLIHVSWSLVQVV